MSRVEIEARFFLFTSLGALVHSDRFCPKAINQEQMVADLLTRYPLEHWHAMHLLTREQVCAWLERALVIITSDASDSST